MSVLFAHQFRTSKVLKILAAQAKSKRSVSYTAITLSLFSLSFFGLFAIRPTLITGITLMKSVSDLKNINIAYENKIGNLIKGQTEYERIRPEIQLIENTIPRNADFHDLVSMFEKQAVQTNVRITQMQIDPVPVSRQSQTQQQFQEFGFNLVSTGSYTNLDSFLQQLLNKKRVITIRQLEMNQEGSSISGEIRLLLKGIAYYES